MCEDNTNLYKGEASPISTNSPAMSIVMPSRSHCAIFFLFILANSNIAIVHKSVLWKDPSCRAVSLSSQLTDMTCATYATQRHPTAVPCPGRYRGLSCCLYMNDETMLDRPVSTRTQDGRWRRPDSRPEVPAANHNRNRDRPLHLPARVASCPREHARDAREQPTRRENRTRVPRPLVRGREEGRVPRERDDGPDEDERSARADAVGEDASDDGGDASRSVGRDGEKLGGRRGEAEAGDDGREEEGEGIPRDDEAEDRLHGKGKIEI